MTDQSPAYQRSSAERVIECAIGLFDKTPEPGQYPPVLAADIMAALKEAGFMFMRDLSAHPDPHACAACGSEFADSKRWCEWCDPDDSWTPQNTASQPPEEGA